VLISTVKHGSEVVIVAGNQGDTGRTLSRKEHFDSIVGACRVVGQWELGRSVRLVGLWIGEDWKPVIVCESAVSTRRNNPDKPQ
jgi:hypothetical protein